VLLIWGLPVTPVVPASAPASSLPAAVSSASALRLIISSYSALSEALPLFHVRGNHQQMNISIHTAMTARTATGMMI
jgi:hypothetical protein